MDDIVGSQTTRVNVFLQKACRRYVSGTYYNEALLDELIRETLSSYYTDELNTKVKTTRTLVHWLGDNRMVKYKFLILSSFAHFSLNPN